MSEGACVLWAGFDEIALSDSDQMIAVKLKLSDFVSSDISPITVVKIW